MCAQKRTEKYDGGSCGHRSCLSWVIRLILSNARIRPQNTFPVTRSSFPVQVHAHISMSKHPRACFFPGFSEFRSRNSGLPLWGLAPFPDVHQAPPTTGPLEAPPERLRLQKRQKSLQRNRLILSKYISEN